MIPTLKLNETHHIDRRAVTLLNLGLLCIGGAVLYIEHRNKKAEPLIPQSEAMALADHAYTTGREHERNGLPYDDATVDAAFRAIVDQEHAEADASLVDDATPPLEP